MFSIIRYYKEAIVKSSAKRVSQMFSIVSLSILISFPFIAESKIISILKANFLTPHNDAKRGVYWYFMDGNMTKASITADLESMKEAGIGNVLFLEVNVGIPPNLSINK